MDVWDFSAKTVYFCLQNEADENTVDSDDGFFVEHGYLSEGEGIDEDAEVDFGFCLIKHIILSL